MGPVPTYFIFDLIELPPRLPEQLLPGYRAATEAYFDALCSLGSRLLRLLALSLRLPANHFGPYFTRPMVSSSRCCCHAHLPPPPTLN